MEWRLSIGTTLPFTLPVLGAEYETRMSSACIFLPSLVTSSLLHSNIHPSNMFITEINPKRVAMTAASLVASQF
jgi:hypothetical protein